MSRIYERFCETKNYDDNLKRCIAETVDHLFNNETDVNHPGMLLGKVQSGKTRAFIGIIGLSFDRGYDIAIVLTKGTKALAKQTYERLEQEFEEFVEDDDVKIYDIIAMPENALTAYALEKKLIFVAKKEENNLERLLKLFRKSAKLRSKKVLIIDDEADYASVGFRRDKMQDDEIAVNSLAGKIDSLRKIGVQTDFLQVTATPYSLYLQPQNMVVNGEEYHSVRPRFTMPIPVHDKYIGSEFYFENSEDPNSPASFLHVDVPEAELEVLSRSERHYPRNILRTKSLKIFRKAIINFIVGGTIRRLQEAPKNYKCSCIIHIESHKKKHAWQFDIVESFLREIAQKENRTLLKKMIRNGYRQFSRSVKHNLPPLNEVMNSAVKAVTKSYIKVEMINSEQRVESLLDKKGQLRLESPFNIFIGGQILDRGITIENLILFFYGRNPKKFQQDTVLQHSGMYGARSPQDIAVTRFYTSGRIYQAMKKMHFFDKTLWEFFEKNNHNPNDMVFIQADSEGDIRPCSPSKILISSTEILRPYRRFLPVGMQTASVKRMRKINAKLSRILAKCRLVEGREKLVSVSTAMKIVDLIAEGFEYSELHGNEAYRWNVNDFKSVMSYLCSLNENRKNKIYCVLYKSRNISRCKDNNAAYSDAPEGGAMARLHAKRVAIDTPVLQLFRQNGSVKLGWRGSCFLWPVLVCPGNTKISVFASEAV